MRKKENEPSTDGSPDSLDSPVSEETEEEVEAEEEAEAALEDPAFPWHAKRSEGRSEAQRNVFHSRRRIRQPPGRKEPSKTTESDIRESRGGHVKPILIRGIDRFGIIELKQ